MALTLTSFSSILPWSQSRASVSSALSGGLRRCAFLPLMNGQQNARIPEKQEHGKVLESSPSSPSWPCGDWPLQRLASEMSQGGDSVACTGHHTCVLSQVVQSLLSVLLKSSLFVQYPWSLLLSQLNYVSEFEPSIFPKVPYQSQLSLQFRSILTRSWYPVNVWYTFYNVMLGIKLRTCLPLKCSPPPRGLLEFWK